MKDINLVQKTGWLVSSALLLTSLPALASSNGLCGSTECLLIAAQTSGPFSEKLRYVPGALPENGEWHIGLNQISTLGGTDWQPIVGDFNNDNHDDLAVYRDGVFQVEFHQSGFVSSSSAVYTMPSSTPWNANSIPVVGNWDGIGGDDFGIYTDGVFTLFPNWSDFTDTISIDFQVGPQIPHPVFTQMPFSGPIDDDPSGKARVGVYFGTWAKYANVTADGTYNFQTADKAFVNGIEYNRPHFWAQPLVIDVIVGGSTPDHRLVFMMAPGTGSIPQEACDVLNSGYLCQDLVPGTPQTQRPIVTPPPDDFN